MPETPHVNTKDAARYLTLSKSMLEKARTNGTGPQYLQLGRAVRYRLADLDAWLDERVVTSTKG